MDIVLKLAAYLALNGILFLGRGFEERAKALLSAEQRELLGRSEARTPLAGLAGLICVASTLGGYLPLGAFAGAYVFGALILRTRALRPGAFSSRFFRLVFLKWALFVAVFALCLKWS